jgi:hypothetical protein
MPGGLVGEGGMPGGGMPGGGMPGGVLGEGGMPGRRLRAHLAAASHSNALGGGGSLFGGFSGRGDGAKAAREVGAAGEAPAVAPRLAGGALAGGALAPRKHALGVTGKEALVDVFCHLKDSVALLTCFTSCWHALLVSSQGLGHSANLRLHISSSRLHVLAA